jgi:hypothetical protein
LTEPSVIVAAISVIKITQYGESRGAAKRDFVLVKEQMQHLNNGHYRN